MFALLFIYVFLYIYILIRSTWGVFTLKKEKVSFFFSKGRARSARPNCGFNVFSREVDHMRAHTLLCSIHESDSKRQCVWKSV